MARQGSMLCKRLMSLSVNTELHSSASNPDPNVHTLFTWEAFISAYVMSIKYTFYVATCEYEECYQESYSVRLLFHTSQGQKSKLASAVQLKIGVVLIKSRLHSWQNEMSLFQICDCYINKVMVQKSTSLGEILANNFLKTASFVLPVWMRLI